MLNTKLKHVVFFLGLILSPQDMPAAESESILLGLTLKDPLVRVSVDKYISERGGGVCKLAIGAGHIEGPMSLHPAYRPDGGISLTESIQGSGNYAFHKHEGWYTLSAETDAAFGSDLVGNIRTPSHQDAVLLPNTWDLIWDESYHPAVLSAEHLFEKALASLKAGGVFIFTLSIHEQEGVWTTGHECDNAAVTGEFNEKLAYKPLSEKFDSLESIRANVSANLAKIGFSSVELHQSILMTAINNLTGKASFEEIDESVLEPSDSEIMRIVTDGCHPLLRLDPIFAHTGGMYYVVATK